MGEIDPAQSKEKSIKEHLEGGWASKVLEWLKEDGGKNLLLLGLTVPLANLLTGGALFDVVEGGADTLADGVGMVLEEGEEGTRAILEKLGGFTTNLAEEPAGP
ncbi:hypothetical protein GF362_01540 [Candidatus Dojkabacteria bacterium]|nr:hypothetical protein [Candidatus Dojkabacteria bacterium]